MLRIWKELAVLVGCALPSCAATYAVNLSGKVVDATGTGMAGVEIVLKGSDLKTNTDASGKWSLKKELPVQINILRPSASTVRSEASEGMFNLRGQWQNGYVGAGIYVRKVGAGNPLPILSLAKTAAEMDSLLIRYQGETAGAVPVGSLTDGALSDMILLKVSSRAEPVKALTVEPTPFFSLANRTVQVDFSYDQALWRPDYLAVGKEQYPVGVLNQKSFEVSLEGQEDILVVLHMLSRTQTIDFASISDQTFGTTMTVTATATSGLPVEITSLTEEICTVDAGQVTYLSGGTCKLQAVQKGSTNYNPAAIVTRTFEVLRASQTITFTAPLDPHFGSTVSLVAGSDSKLPVTLTSTTESVCTIDQGYATFVAGGICTIEASQPGNKNYEAAELVTRSFTVLPVAQTITFTALVAPTYGTTVALDADSDSKLPVTYTSTTESVCTIFEDNVMLIGTGTCTIEASQAGNANYAAAEPVTQNFEVLKADQTFSVEPLSLVYRGASGTLVATASSQMAVTYQSLTPGICTVNGTDISPVVVGTCQIQVSQAGDDNYEPASTTVNIPVTKMPVTLTVNGPTKHISPLNPYGFAKHVTVSPAIAGMVRYASTTPDICTIDEKRGDIVFVRPIPLNDNYYYSPGVCGIQVSLPENDSTLAAPAIIISAFKTFGIYHDTRDNEFYKTVHIELTDNGHSTWNLWMAENMRYNVSGSKSSNIASLGRYYSPSMLPNICPSGWSLYGSDFFENGTFFSSSKFINENYTNRWSSFAGDGWSQTTTNESGFSLLPNGYFSAYYGNVIREVGSVAVLWGQENQIGITKLAVHMTPEKRSLLEWVISNGHLLDQGSFPTFHDGDMFGARCIKQRSQTINFPAIPNQTFGTTLSLNPTATSGLPVTLTSFTRNICNVKNGLVTYERVGVCTIYAEQLGNIAHQAAPWVTQSFEVLPAAQ